MEFIHVYSWSHDSFSELIFKKKTSVDQTAKSESMVDRRIFSNQTAPASNQRAKSFFVHFTREGRGEPRPKIFSATWQKTKLVPKWKWLNKKTAVSEFIAFHIIWLFSFMTISTQNILCILTVLTYLDLLFRPLQKKQKIFPTKFYALYGEKIKQNHQENTPRWTNLDISELPTRPVEPSTKGDISPS